MKRLIPFALCLTLLSGCAGKSSSDQQWDTPPVPPAPQESDLVTYQVTPLSYSDTIYAHDGTLLMKIDLQYPSLEVLVNGVPMEAPATSAQQEAQAKADAFNEAFAVLTSEASLSDTIAMAEEQYSYTPELFTEIGEAYAEEFTYESCRMGNVISVSGMDYSYLGGVHPNIVYHSWNFDLESGNFFTLPALAEDPSTFTLDIADQMEADATERSKDPEYGGDPDFTLTDFYWPDYRQVLEQWPELASVYLGESGMQIIFSAYDLTYYAAGPQMFTIPYAELDSYWSDAGRATLGLNE